LDAETEMKVGYARVSTADQNLDSQLDALKKAGCEKIFSEKVSGTRSDREQLAEAITYIRKGDTLVVFKLDRLGRSLKKLIELIDEFKEKGIHFQSIHENIDTSSPTGEFFFHIIASFSQLERSLIVERTKAGLAAARARGRLGGRPETISKSKKEMAYDLYMEGKKTVDEIVEPLGMSRMTFYRYLATRTDGRPKRTEVSEPK
jgi:DNA invertase Pin-like site-specific DNA recombinase